MRILFIVCIALTVTGCPKPETAPCDAQTLAALVASCKDKADCHEKIEAREKFCGARIEEEYQPSAGGKSQ